MNRGRWADERTGLARWQSLVEDRYMSVRRYKVRVVALARDGRIEVVHVRRERSLIHLLVDATTVPMDLQIEGSEFVIKDDIKTSIPHVKRRLEFEPNGETWLKIQDTIRPVLISSWDPMRFNGLSPDEYDRYISEVYAMLVCDATSAEVAELLAEIEADRMRLSPSPLERRLSVAQELKTLELPDVTA